MAKKSASKRAAKPAQGARRAKATTSASRDAVLDAAMRLAAEQGWRGLTLVAIAEEAGLTLAELYARYTSKQAILDGVRRAADRAMLAGGAVPDGPARDRLFEVLMRRFDALAAWRAGIASAVEATSCDPIALLCSGPGMVSSMSAVLEAAGLDSSGLRGLIRAKALAAVWLPAMRTWLGDESEDQAATMASLDKGLRRLDACARFCQRPFAAPEKAPETA
jgi:AcrR family transcriptional regulator